MSSSRQQQYAVSSATGRLPSQLEQRTTPVMAALALVWLLLVAALIPSLSTDHSILAPSTMQHVYVTGLILVWIAFMAEFGVHVTLRWRAMTVTRVLYAALGAVLPPLRMGRQPVMAPGHVWIPFIGWRKADRQTERAIERRLSGPMMVVAVMILPVLGLEFLGRELVEQRVWLQQTLDIATRVIWLAFAIEFCVMLAVTPKKFSYCKEQWLNLAIILLPLVSFLRVLRVTRVARLTKLQQSVRVYRLRGTGTRIFKALLLLKLIERFSHRAAKARLAQLQNSLQAKEEELEDIRRRIADLEYELEQHESSGMASDEADADA